MRITLSILLSFLTFQPAQDSLPRLKVAQDGHYLMTENGRPFFWLGDTGWLLLSRLTTEQAGQYLDNRASKGFNMIQVMLVHGLKDTDVYGDSALIHRNLATPAARYWDHLDTIIDMAGKKGIYLALVPVWGGVVKGAKTTPDQAKAYAGFLAGRYKNKPNIVWMNGGDIKGSDYKDVWITIGATLKAQDPGHLITFHPRGRASSSFWFEDQPWLDFNSVQSGHRSYAQDTSKDDPRYGEDNWRYIRADYGKTPARPVIIFGPTFTVPSTYSSPGTLRRKARSASWPRASTSESASSDSNSPVGRGNPFSSSFIFSTTNWPASSF